MAELRKTVFKAGVSLLHATQLFRLAPLIARPRGIVFMLHRVRPRIAAEFAPNNHLEVSPGFLDQAIEGVVRAGFDLVDLDEAARRIGTGSCRPFAAFTLDDGYRDNAARAAPIFRRHNCPYTIFVPSEFAEGRGELWWLVLEQAIAAADRIATEIGGEHFALACGTASEKSQAFKTLYVPLRRVGEAEQRRAIRQLAAAAGIDMAALCRGNMMDWAELRDLAADPLCTIGAHGIGHYALAKLPPGEALAELRVGADRLAEALGRRPKHFAYPYGDPGSAGPRDFALARQAGFLTAVTTRPGIVYGGHAEHLTALPRVSLTEAYPVPRYADVFPSGAPFLLYNCGQALDVA
jgi:peptidoglycan/xylan/chitin deacetylase (PgdA/CDA1 family)